MNNSQILFISNEINKCSQAIDLLEQLLGKQETIINPEKIKKKRKGASE